MYMADKNKPEPIEDKDLEDASGGAVQKVRQAANRVECSNSLHSETPTTSTTLEAGG
jgi:hypothetical protein